MWLQVRVRKGVTVVMVLLRGRTLRSPGGACEPEGGSSRFGALREGGGALTAKILP